MFVCYKKLILFIFVLSPIIAKRVKQFKSIEQNIELSAKHELSDYLASLDDIIGFSLNYKYHGDVNLGFGLFLINVHLKSILNGENKYNKLPKTMQDKLLRIVSKNDLITKNFKKMVAKKQFSKANAETKIATMIMDESKWMKRLPKFNTDLVFGYSQYNKANWKIYSRDVLDPDSWVPSPQESDICMASIASSPIERTGHSTKCRISTACKDIIMNGTNFGYAFTHRLLMLQIADFGRGCRIFSDQLDMEIRNSICATAFLEVDYISSNDYGIVDLMAEIISLCALDGHAEFLRSSWLKNIRRFQTPYGCFSETKVSNDGNRNKILPKTMELVYDTRNKNWKLVMEKKNVINDTCNAHVTAVVAASLSAAARFIIETYY